MRRIKEEDTGESEGQGTQGNESQELGVGGKSEHKKDPGSPGG